MTRGTLVLAVLLLFIGQPLMGQSFCEVVDDDSTETAEERAELLIGFLQDIPFDHAADVGSGNLRHILRIVNAFPDRHFTLEDIDSSACNPGTLRQRIQEGGLDRVDTALLAFHIGNANSTGLPAGRFDLVLLCGVLHVLEDPDAILQDLARILRPGGSLVIEDVFYDSPPAPHPSCGTAYWTEDYLDSFLDQAGWFVQREWKRTGVATRSNGPYVTRIVQCALP